MEDVRAQYAELKDTMSTFQVSVSECLSKAEAEFLQAYRAHMVEVHRELQGLRDKLSEAESSMSVDPILAIRAAVGVERADMRAATQSRAN